MEKRSLSCHMIDRMHESSVHLLLNDESEIEEVDLGTVELSRGIIQSLTTTADLMSELYMNGTNLEYPEITRSITEFKGGYKLALQRGVPLYNTRVFNLLFRLKNKKIDTISDLQLATMYTTARFDRWILLHPDDTAQRIEYEKDYYRRAAYEFVRRGKASEGELDKLHENLELLSIPERCAQTLMHEYGHILHWQAFHKLFEKYGLRPNGELPNNLLLLPMLEWFERHSYLYNVSMRIQGFKKLPLKEKLHILRESFVEDYRIGLNMKSLDGKIVLPNQYCFVADLMNPQLLQEGVRIVNIMLDEERRNELVSSQDAERDRVKISQKYVDLALETDWSPGDDVLTSRDVRNLKNRLLADAIKRLSDQGFEMTVQQIAAATERDRIRMIR